MRRSFTGARFTVALLLVAACSGPVDPASAYEDEVFLCSDETLGEREARTAECRRGADCRGWVSFRGTLQAQLVTVDASLLAVEFDLQNAPGVGLARDAITLYGDSPYFRLRWVFSDLPAIKDTNGDIESPVSIHNDGGTVESSLRLNGGGTSVDLPARSGVFRTRWDNREQVGDAHLDFGSGNSIDGCFFARVSLESGQ